ncbi:Uncharacterised protein [Rothia dentocariosa]|uniref:Uncharacterized protein n=1 Tax=Rothia dentocariosa TaxID=2047 RepID=A0A448UX96_9MICC|nr:Uncharacterised protein [Rothia dentocariosa]
MRGRHDCGGGGGFWGYRRGRFGDLFSGVIPVVGVFLSSVVWLLRLGRIVLIPPGVHGSGIFDFVGVVSDYCGDRSGDRFVCLEVADVPVFFISLDSISFGGTELNEFCTRDELTC